jgi:hypothetical protein
MTIRIAHQHWLDKMVRSGDMGHRCVQGHWAQFGETAGTQGGFPCLGVRPPRGNTHDPVQRQRPGDLFDDQLDRGKAQAAFGIVTVPYTHRRIISLPLWVVFSTITPDTATAGITHGW